MLKFGKKRILLTIEIKKERRSAASDLSDDLPFRKFVRGPPDGRARADG